MKTRQKIGLSILGVVVTVEEWFKRLFKGGK